MNTAFSMIDEHNFFHRVCPINGNYTFMISKVELMTINIVNGILLPKNNHSMGDSTLLTSKQRCLYNVKTTSSAFASKSSRGSYHYSDLECNSMTCFDLISVSSDVHTGWIHIISFILITMIFHLEFYPFPTHDRMMIA